MVETTVTETMTSPRRVAYPVRTLEQRPMVLSVIHGLHNNYDYAKMESLFCVGFYGSDSGMSDSILEAYNLAPVEKRAAYEQAVRDSMAL